MNGAAWLGKVQVGERSTDKVLGFEKGPLKGLVKVQFDQMGRSTNLFLSDFHICSESILPFFKIVQQETQSPGSHLSNFN